MAKHALFISRTILVTKEPDSAMKMLNRIMANEGLFDLYQRTRRYEKPFLVRRRVNHERCKSLMNEDLNRKIKFLLRKDRVDPFPAN